MRTPNCSCLICGKPLYRRPNELKKVRHVACMAHRAEAQKVSGVTEKQAAGLSLGREKGTNHRTGYKHKAESRVKASVSHRAYCAANPDKVKERAEKTRGEKHYRWNGGSSILGQDIRRMTEYRKWATAVRKRDGRCCVRCRGTFKLESHHVSSFAELLARHGIKSREDARRCAPLWDISNGITLCEPCHYIEHGRTYENQRNDLQENADTPTEPVREAA